MDMDRLAALLDEWGVEYTVRRDPVRIALELRAGDDFAPGNKVTGHMGFFTRFEFTANGKFAGIGIWE